MVDMVEAKLEEDRIACGSNRAGDGGCGARDNGRVEAAVMTRGSKDVKGGVAGESTGCGGNAPGTVGNSKGMLRVDLTILTKLALLRSVPEASPVIDDL